MNPLTRAHQAAVTLAVARASEPTVTLALPGKPVERAMTWARIEAYLTAQGWRRCKAQGMAGDVAAPSWAQDMRLWRPADSKGAPQEPSVILQRYLDPAEGMTAAIRTLAFHAAVTPGEMLAAIADHGAAPVRRSGWEDGDDHGALPAGRHHLRRDGIIRAIVTEEDGGARFTVFTVDGKASVGVWLPKVGEAMAAAERALGLDAIVAGAAITSADVLAWAGLTCPYGVVECDLRGGRLCATCQEAARR